MFKAKKTLTLLLLLLTLPLLLFDLWGYNTFKQSKGHEKKLSLLSKRLHSLYRVEAENKQLLTMYLNADPSYIHTSLESLKLPTSPSSIEFIEKLNPKTPYFQEKKETLVKRVNVDFEDLKEILNRIELLENELPRGHPHLIISDFTLKKNKSMGDHFYHLDLELLKRDYSF